MLFLVFFIFSIFITNYIDFNIINGFVNFFRGEAQDISDLIRMEQLKYISMELVNNLLWGIGIGGHAYGCIRNDNNNWQYELEYMALIM